ncbi:hypothetical protein E3N88_26099 [Mikania micrantha]|uniref:Retrotransposon gag domain-containing protein n=1 Tax=Mikania micrantha TaxID=192012 RepID=A0A5N6N889_9ASTR|nr:hypothetical protein E3N88_26099 [Mikania micrantha]
MVTQLHNSLNKLSNNSQDHPHNNTGENSKTFTFKQFNDARPRVFSGTEGAIGLLQWFESIEDTLDYTNCPEDQEVKMAASAFQKEALTWWNTEKRNRGRDAALGLSWTSSHFHNPNPNHNHNRPMVVTIVEPPSRAGRRSTTDEYHHRCHHRRTISHHHEKSWETNLGFWRTKGFGAGSTTTAD